MTQINNEYKGISVYNVETKTLIAVIKNTTIASKYIFGILNKYKNRTNKILYHINKKTIIKSGDNDLFVNICLRISSKDQIKLLGDKNIIILDDKIKQPKFNDLKTFTTSEDDLRKISMYSGTVHLNKYRKTNNTKLFTINDKPTVII